MKTLFIVDIQSKFRNSFNEEYLDETISYLNKKGKDFDKIVCIMEKNVSEGDYVPKEVFEKLTYYPVFKLYEASYTREKLLNSTHFNINKGEITSNVEIPMGSFIFKENGGYIIGNRTNTSISMDFVCNGLYQLLNSLRDDDITIVGGGLYNCVKKTQDFLNFMGIDSVIDKEYCYTLEEDDSCSLDRFDYYVEKRNDT